jgi:hypothetical protein
MWGSEKDNYEVSVERGTIACAPHLRLSWKLRRPFGALG